MQRGRASRQNQFPRENRRGRDQRNQYDQNIYQSGQDNGNQRQGGGDQIDRYPSEGYNSAAYQVGRFQNESQPAIPAPSTRTQATIRNVDRQNATALSQPPNSSSGNQVLAETYLYSVTSNLDERDRAITPQSEYRYPTTITGLLDHYEPRQSISSRESASGVVSRYPQENRQGRSSTDGSSRNSYNNSERQERRDNRNNSGR